MHRNEWGMGCLQQGGLPIMSHEVYLVSISPGYLALRWGLGRKIAKTNFLGHF